MFTDRNSELNDNQNLNIDRFDGSGEKNRNDEWRRRDFDDDYIKNVLNEFKTTVKIIYYLLISRFKNNI